MPGVQLKMFSMRLQDSRCYRPGESLTELPAEGRSHVATADDRPVASKRTAIGLLKQPEANLDFLEGEAGLATSFWAPPHHLL